MADASEVFINDGSVANFVPFAGSKDKTLVLTTAYQKIMFANATRVGYEFEAAIAATGTISIRYGSSSTVFEIVAGGSHIRGPRTGGVFVGDIWAKSSVNADNLIAREW